MFKRDSELTKLVEKIEALSKRVAELKGEKDAKTEELGLSSRVVELQREKTRLEIELDRVKEKHEREQRAIRLSALTTEILERLPVVKVDRHIRETVGAVNGNGSDEDDDADLA